MSNTLEDWKVEMEKAWREAKTVRARNALTDPYIDNIKQPDEMKGLVASQEFKKQLKQLLGSKVYKRKQIAANFNKLCHAKDYQKLQNGEIDVKAIDEAVNKWRLLLKSKNVETGDTCYYEAFGRTAHKEKDDYYLVIRPYKFGEYCGLDFGRQCVFNLDYTFNYYTDNKQCAGSGYFTVDARGSIVLLKSKNKQDLVPPKEIKNIIDEYINYQIVAPPKPNKRKDDDDNNNSNKK